MLIDTMKILKATMGNPISRHILKTGLKPCEECRTRIEHALAIFAEESHPTSASCRIYSSLMGALLWTGGRIFRVKHEDLKAYFKDTTTRRGLASVLKGIGEYGITKPQRLGAPFLVVWNYTNACNLNCKHCYQSAGKIAPDELNTEERLQIIDEMADAGVVAIAFSGGEPLMRKDFYEIASRAKENGMYVALATNGTLLTKDVVKKLKASGVEYVEISLDAATPERHDDFRGVPGAFSKTLAGIANCVEQDIFTCIATTVTQANLYDIPLLIDLAEQAGAKRFLAFNFIPTGRGKVDLDITPEQREEFLRMLFEKSKETKIEILSTAPQYARVCLECSKGEMVAPTHFYVGQAYWDIEVLAEFIGGCGAGRLYCALQPNGDVTPCVFMPGLTVGNIRETPFLDIWHDSEVMQALRDRDLLRDNCHSCEYKCVCGGCRARAYAYSGDYLMSDPGCVNNKAFYDRLTGEMRSERQLS